MLQDALLALDVGLVVVALGGATTGSGGRRHMFGHVVFSLAALVLPLACFDLARLDLVPPAAWLFCAFYALGHVANTAFHLARPDANHSLGPEVLVQTVTIGWGGSLLASIDPAVWHRGTVGLVVFSLTSVFVATIVLMVFYQSELAAHPRDDVDLRAGLRTKSNAALLCCGPTALGLTLFLALRDVGWVVGAVAWWAAVRAAMPPLPRAWTPAP